MPKAAPGGLPQAPVMVVEQGEPLGLMAVEGLAAILEQGGKAEPYIKLAMQALVVVAAAVAVVIVVVRVDIEVAAEVVLGCLGKALMEQEAQAIFPQAAAEVVPAELMAPPALALQAELVVHTVVLGVTATLLTALVAQGAFVLYGPETLDLSHQLVSAHLNFLELK